MRCASAARTPALPRTSAGAGLRRVPGGACRPLSLRARSAQDLDRSALRPHRVRLGRGEPAAYSARAALVKNGRRRTVTAIQGGARLVQGDAAACRRWLPPSHGPVEAPWTTFPGASVASAAGSGRSGILRTGSPKTQTESIGLLHVYRDSCGMGKGRRGTPLLPPQATGLPLSPPSPPSLGPTVGRM
jgi:hypothetical protein